MLLSTDNKRLVKSFNFIVIQQCMVSMGQRVLLSVGSVAPNVKIPIGLMFHAIL